MPIFYEVLEPDLSLYHDLGFDLFKLGELATIRLDEFTLAGKRWEDLRQAVNRSVKERLTFEIVEPPFDTVLMTEVERVSDFWLSDKHASEKGFSLGRFDPDYFAWSPLALVRRDGELVAFANVLPPYGPHGTASVDLMRQTADAPRGTMDFLFAKVMQWAKDRGYETFSLGMAPLSAVGDNPTRASTSGSRRLRSSTADASTTIRDCGATRKSSSRSGPARTSPIRAGCGCRGC